MGSQLRGWGAEGQKIPEGRLGPGHHTVVNRCFDLRGQAESREPRRGRGWTRSQTGWGRGGGVRGGHSAGEEGGG